MRITHDVQIDKATVLSTEGAWLRLDHFTKDEKPLGGTLIRRDHIVKVERSMQEYDGATYFWHTLVDRANERTVLPFALTAEESMLFADALAS